MKKILSLIALLVSSILINAQDCSGYYPLNKGTSFELTSYNKKDKIESVINNIITNSKDISNGIEATVDMSIKDKKGEQISNLSYAIKCQDSKYYIDFKNMLSPQLTTQYEGMDIVFDEGFAAIPNNLTTGDKLDDVEMNMKMSSNGMVIMTMKILISDRIVTGKETQKTSAGTFDCIILSQNTTVKMGEMMTVKTSSKEWLAKGVGNVRTESYDKKGELDSYTILTNFSK